MRRKPYTKVVKTNQIRAEHVRGMGDVVFKGFQCLNSECLEFIFIRKNEIGSDSESRKINSEDIYKRFGYRCFKCGKDLRGVGAKERPLDHTLPAVFLWPLTTENATLLCREHNGEKSGKWPSEYYSQMMS